MSTESPQVGEISADGQFRWDGAEWAPLARGHREPTSWTLPLRRIVAAFLVLSALAQILTYGLFTTEASLEKSLRSSGSQLTGDQLHSAATVSYAVGFVLFGVIAAVLLVLAAGSFLGWRWVFWVDLVVLALSSIGVITNAAALLSSATQQLPTAWVAVGFLLSVVALALLIWLIVAAARYGPWAMRRPGVA